MSDTERGPLSAEEIAELTPALGDCILPPVGRGEYVSLDRATYERLRNALPRLLDEVERSRALLKRIEWTGSASNRVCPDCGNVDEHAPGCELAALIGGFASAWTPQPEFKPGDIVRLDDMTRILDADGVTFRPLKPGEG